MRLGILGPLLVADDAGCEIRVAAARQRALLTALLLRANRIVPADELADIVWDAAPPPGAAGTLRTYMARLRRVVGPQVAARIETREPGYLIRVMEAELDALRFEALCQQTDVALRAESWAEASATAAEALELWRGEPLLDVPSHMLRERCAPRFEQLRLQALEDLVETQLRLGRREGLILQLRELTAAHPLRERLHAQLMLALSGSGRQAEALEAYRHARRVLVGELGIEPGPELRRLHKRILDGDAVLAAPDPANQVPPFLRATDAPTPRQLPAAVRHFIGRRAEIDELLGLPDVSDPAAAAGTVVISAIDGMAGIGKTALAVQAAHRMAGRFPDGQLFIDLHGYTKGYPPREPGEALGSLLRALDVPAQRIPEDTEERAALYRQRMADTKTLIVLDNALDEAQVRPLLPGAPGCLVLITSRRRLKGLDDAASLSLDLPSPADAVALLHAVAGPGRLPSGDPLLGEVARLCGRLPLALRIAGALLRHRQAWSLERLAGLLRDQKRRVASLSDGERDLSAVFDLSYASLSERHRVLLRCLGLIPGPDVDAFAAAALLDCDPAGAAGLLENLVDHNLLIAHADGRYRLHDLIRAHAGALADHDPAYDRKAALDRLLHYYAHTAQSASVVIARFPRPQPVGPAPAHTPAVTARDAARAWLRGEHPNLDAAFTHADAHRLDGHVIALAAGLAEILQADGPSTRALEIHRVAAETAERVSHPDAHANAMTDLGRVRQVIGDYPGANDFLTRALELYRTLGNRLGIANALTDLGRVRQVTGDHAAARDLLTEVLELCQALGNRLGEANALTDLGRVQYLTGDHSEARDALSRALELYQALGDSSGEAYVLTDLGRMRTLTGDYRDAEDALTRALHVYHALGNRHGEANVLTNLGRVRYLTGDHAEAIDALTKALALHRALGHHLGEAYALGDLARVRTKSGDYPGANDLLTRALQLYRALGHRLGEASVLTESGRVRTLTGDHFGAGDALTRALKLYRTLGDRSNEAWALNYYAAAVAATGDLPHAVALYRQSLAMNRELNKPDDEALALEGLGECHLSVAETEPGTTYLRDALQIYRRLGMTPDAERVHTRLDDLAHRSPPPGHTP